MTAILIVGNDSKVNVNALTMLGYRLVKSTDGQDALRKLKNEPFDIMITPLELAGASGVQLIESLHKNMINRDCHVIVASALTDDVTLNQFISNKRVHFVSISNAAVDLHLKIEQILNPSRQVKTIDVRIINPILTAALEVISSSMGPVKAKAPYIKKEAEVAGDISVIFGMVSAEFKGNISFSFYEEGFLKLVAKMFQIELQEINAAGQDAFSEIAKMISEKAKQRLSEAGFNFQLVSPSIISDKKHHLRHHSNLHPMVIVFQNEEAGGGFRAEICSTG